MNIRICIQAIIVMGITNAAPESSARAALVSGAATVNNGSVLTFGQPFVGSSHAANNSMSLAFGLLPPLAPRTNAPSTFGISPAVTMENGRFEFGFFIQPGKTWIIEGSTNLVDWSPLGAGTAAFPWIEFRDSTSFLFPARFYRVRLP